jgi:hypothetical protein
MRTDGAEAAGDEYVHGLFLSEARRDAEDHSAMHNR